jgi:peptidoglycan/LPS O-acetylase OafA/YrhL
VFVQLHQKPESKARDASDGFRTDIEGLRAVAILAVLLCHSGIAAFAGGYVGVDVFFVISGFLITRLLLGEVQHGGTISIPRFYARRAKRILPLAAVLLISVATLSLVLLSPLRAMEVSGDIVASALYIANWHFAAQSVNYFSLGIEPSPLLHLWSLGIEEQFYLVWPTLLLAVVWIGRRFGGSVRGTVWIALVLLFAGSLVLGIEQTEAQPTLAYFSTFDRAWELALGAGLALLGSAPIPRSAGAGLGWVGMAAIVYAVLAFNAQTPFPGTAALVPTLGTAALILAGGSIHGWSRLSPAAGLSVEPVRYVGRISYAWYMWHWPALVFGAVIFGTLSPLAGVLLVLASLVPTVASHHLVEEPARRARSLVQVPSRGLALGAVCMTAGVLAGTLLIDLEPTLRTLPAALAKGAVALHKEPYPQQRVTAIRPNPLYVRGDLPRPISEGCLAGINGTRSGPCIYGDPHGARSLILFGDSHAMQQFPSLQLIAKRNRWRLVVLTKRECTPAAVTIRGISEARAYSQCGAWRLNELRRIERIGTATVVISSDSAYIAYGPHGEELAGRANADALEAGYVATLRRIRRAGLSAVVIHDTPEAPIDVPSCVSENVDALSSCTFKQKRMWDRNFDLRAARRVPGISVINLTPEICPKGLCRAVIGNVLVYRDSGHLTVTYARTLSPWLEPTLRRATLH